jgi:hypothetical protein
MQPSVMMKQILDKMRRDGYIYLSLKKILVMKC